MAPLSTAAPWTLDEQALLTMLASRRTGLSGPESAARVRLFGPNTIDEQQRDTALRTLARQLRSPLPLLLVFAAIVSAGTHQWIDAGVVSLIVTVTVGVGYRREHVAERAVQALKSRLVARCDVLRDGHATKIDREQLVPGDVVLLSAGSLVPADCILLEATDCYVNEAVVTGESYPVRKQPGVFEAAAPIGKRGNCLYLGSNIRSGTAQAVVARTGKNTELGAVAHRLAREAPETEFDRGLRRFGYLLTGSMAMLVTVIFAAHVFRGRPPLETLLFAVALAVGLTPELLPAILGVNLARGAQRLAERKVLVRRLNAIENLGSMDVLCTDKTGTLTEGSVELCDAIGFDGERSEMVLELAAVNAALETGVASPLDDAIEKARRPALAGITKRGEIPFDFVRKRVSVIVEDAAGCRLITKGAFAHVLEACAVVSDGSPLTDARRRALLEAHEALGKRGIRTLAVAQTPVARAASYHRDDEKDLVFVGYVTFLDRPKAGAREAVAELAALGVTTKVITGDARAVCEHVAELVGLRGGHVLTGADLDAMTDEALAHRAEHTTLFVEVDPNQKERIILALKKTGHVVGFLGDGVNDAPAMHAADTSVSVEEAVDVAREAADFVLLERDLDVILGGVREGRRTFVNTQKYVLAAMSANLGNMASMAATSLFLPFLPLLPGQILLLNLLSDVPAVGLASDSVDEELVAVPRRWDLRFVARFTVEFGFLSSAFDMLTFGSLLWVFHAGPTLFRTGWFMESLLTQLVAAVVVRTRRPLWRSRPGALLLRATIILALVALLLPFAPGAAVLGLDQPPILLAVCVVTIAALYVVALELLKHRFYAATVGGRPTRPPLTSAVRTPIAASSPPRIPLGGWNDPC